MKKILLLPILFLLSLTSNSQRLLTWTPDFPTDNSSLVITADCNKGSQGLLNFEGGMSSNVYVHVGVITNLSIGPNDWKYVKFPWGTATAAANAAAIAPNKYQFTIPNVRTFFNVPAGETIIKVNVIFRNTGGTLKQVNSDGSDMYIPIYATGQYAVRLNLPPSEPRYIPWLEPINIAGGFTAVQAVASAPSNLELKYNSTVLNTATGVSTISGTATFGANTCDQTIVANGILGATTGTDSAKFFITPTTTTAALPAGLQDGINYAANNTEVTLVLYAPSHTSVNVIGDFSNWQSLCAYQMTKTPDGNRYFLKLTGLTPGQIYKFQYVVDGTIKTTDPYTELVLDPNNDQYILPSVFPNMPAYPTGLTTGIVGTFQTAAPQYTWTTTSYTRPDKKSLVMYEMHMRDFLATSSWQNLADTLNYIKGLGVNAIEVMPFNEFEGNNSWGYNPDFFFAPDKAYGTKNNLKLFIDMAHSKGMAVIMDAVLNHATGLSPLAQMWWNSSTNNPAANNPYFNVTATHPFSVFNDFNHESDATKAHTARYIRHWLTEYKLDGFRWDLSKGFTQNPCGSNQNCWNAYDASRVAIWQRYHDSSQVVSNGSYTILEHLGNDDEEGDLANRGMLLWGKMTAQYNENTLGYAANSDINRAFFANRPFWSQPHLVTYAESHDEERLMYKNLTFGNSSTISHDVKNLNIALSRMEAMQPFLLLIPGPKMIWQFGELGYDKSIFQCENGTIPQPYGTDNCKTNPKPILWNYNAEVARKKIYNVIAGLNRIRALKPNAFVTNSIAGNLGSDLKKQLIINHPDLKLVALSNFDVVAQNFSVTFPAAGTWYEYFTNTTFTATGSAQTINMQAAEYRVYTNISFCTTALPTVTSPVNLCQNSATTALTATGTNLLWYTTATGGTGSSTAPTPTTTTVGSVTVYVSQTINNCEGQRAAIVVNVNALPAAPAVTTPVIYCQNATAVPLSATGTSLKWFTVPTGGTSSSTAPTPITSAIGSTTYYVSQTNATNCESPRASIVVNVTASTPAPVVTTPVTYCQNATATALNATGTSLLWYNFATGGSSTATAPIPSTSAAGSTIYYVSQTTSCGEGPRAAITVTVNATPAAPTATSPIAYCQNATAVPLTAAGTGLLWFTTATGGGGSATAPTPPTTTAGTITVYVSQTVNGCEGPRTPIVINVTATPAAPIVASPLVYCQNSTSVPLTATGTNLLWYNFATGGSSTATAPTPNTSAIGSTIFYVSQSANSCEGPRAAIAVNIVASTPAPVVTTPVTYCQNATATALTATGTSLLWYTTASGGTGVSTAPIPSTSAAGSTIFYVSQTTSCGEGPRAAITVNVNATPAAPTATSPIAYCQNATASPLTATGTGLLWYTTSTGGGGSATAPTPPTTTPGTITVYVSQTVNGCEGPRTPIVINVTATPAAPTVASPLVYCQNSASVPLTATGTNLLWYTTASGGTGSSTAPTPNTSAIGSTTFYVSQSANTCEGPRAAIVVNIVASTPAPVVTTPIAYCQNATATALTATGTSLLWYTTSTGGTGVSTAPIPSTSAAGSTIFYVSQTTSCGEGPRAAITVTVNATPAAPTATSPIAYCQNATASPLTATGTGLLWFTTATGGGGSATAPTPPTSTAGTITVYVSQTVNGCEGPRTAIVINVTATPATPTVVSPIAYCQNAAATQLSATGTNLLWYTTANGGTGNATAPTPNTTVGGTFNFYVSQTTNGCESPRANIVVNVTATPTVPAVSSTVVYCQNSTASPLTAGGTNILWYTTATGGIGSTSAPTPSTITIGSTTFYASQSLNTCEGPRAAIVVNIIASTPAPVVTTPVTYCQNATAVALTATGTGLLWYTTAAGGTGATTAPIPTTSVAGSTIYYVSQTTSCGEGPRAAITVTINATPAAPLATTPVTYCQNATPVPLTATGTNLKWYTVATGGTATTSAPTPNTTTAGSTTFYVSQTSASNCEGPRTAIVVNVIAATTAPTVTSPITYCQNATAVALSATGTSLLWYTTASGGTGVSTAPIPSTSAAGSTIYYVSQTTSCGEGPRAAITVTVNATPAAPTATSPIAYCQNATASPLTATGSGLLWFTTATGGGGSATAPTPLTTTAGTITVYVSQTVNGCEGPRTPIVINVTATPAAPLVTTPVAYCQNSSSVPLTATGINLVWYTTASGGTGNATAPTPNTTVGGTFNFYVSQTTNGCESPRANIVVNVTATPTVPAVSSTVVYCQNSTASPLTAGGTNILWYTTASGGTGSSSAPTPSTTTIGSTTFYASQSLNTCEGPRAAIVVNIIASTPAPVVTTPVTYCQNATAVALTATGTGLLWYTTASGGSGVTITPIPSTSVAGSTIFYVSQTTSCGEGPRAAITVTVNATPSAPIATTPVTYCQNATPVPLTATGTNLKWYTVATGGTATTSAPTPNTTTAGSTTFYVSQTSASNCEGPRTAIVVNVTAATTAPTVTSPITYCQNATAVALSATGTSLLWYTNATGGTGATTAPTPSTTAAGSTIYYVSQTTSCGEGPRASITVTVNATPAAPAATSPIAYCQNATATPLTATGTGLLWYTTPTGGGGSAISPTPPTTTAGTITVYVSQTVSGCEGPRTAIVINVTATPAAPSVATPLVYCQNSTAVPLTATGTNLLWYVSLTGGTGATIAPTPSTTTIGTNTYYVSQSTSAVGGCESPRVALVVNVVASTAAPVVTTPVRYCQNTTAVALNATGTGLLWYTSATGGTGTATAPTPSTATAGSTIYYVSQTSSCGEGPRAAITVTVNATPNAPTSLSVINITNTSATLNWTGSVGNFYQVQYKPTTSTLWITAATAITATTLNVTGLTNGVVYDWRVNANCSSNPGTLYASSTFSTTTRNTTFTNIKNGYGLKISPNPVRGNAILDYLLPNSGIVKITLLHSNGQFISTLFNGNQNIGQYDLDITNFVQKLAKGVYVIRLQQSGTGHSIRFVKY